MFVRAFGFTPVKNSAFLFLADGGGYKKAHTCIEINMAPRPSKMKDAGATLSVSRRHRRSKSSYWAAADDIDYQYTDKPFVYDCESGVRVPRNGFKGCGGSYVIADAWSAESDMEKYAVDPEMVLKLKTAYERINRGAKKDAAAARGARSAAEMYWKKKRDLIRTLFNHSYFRLDQLAIHTHYRYNMRRYIITPPMIQCTQQYDTNLKRLCRFDGLSPHELQKRRVFLQRDTNGRSASYSAAAKPRLKSSHVNDASLQKLYKALNDAELVNRSIKDQTQGGKSFLKQVVVPGKMQNCLYGKVLPDPTLQPDEIGIPSHVMEGAFSDADMNKVAAIVKRDPVFSSDAITTFTKVVRHTYPYITLPSEIITNKQLDFDGDTVSIMMVHSARSFIEVLMRLSAKIAMYCHFYRTRLTFSQTNGFRIAGLLKHLQTSDRPATAAGGGGVRQADEKTTVSGFFGHTFAHCRYDACTKANVTQQLSETLLSLSQQYGPFVAYGFMMNVRALSFTGYNSGRIYPIGPDPKLMATHIAESGSKGSKESVERMFDISTTRQSHATETMEYAKTFIEAKSLIRKQGHNAKKMDTAFQNIIVNHDDHLTMRVNNVVYDLGHIINYMQREWIMSDLTTMCILEDVREDEEFMRQAAFNIPNGQRKQFLGQPTRRDEMFATTTEGAATNSGGREDIDYHYWDRVIEEALGLQCME